ncbi:MAG: DUF4041 domain-containing protein [Microcoleaceae cyanobacterium]
MLSTPLLLPLIILSLSVFSIYLFVQWIETQRERDELKQELHKHKQKLHRYESLTNKEEYEKQLDENIQLKQTEIEELKDKIKKSESYLCELRAKEYLIEIDEYEPKYDFVNSEDYLQRWQEIKLKQEKMRKNKQAFICDATLTIGEGKEGKKDGQKVKGELRKMIEFAFEEQCKYAIKEVTYNNNDKLKRKIKTIFNKVNDGLQKMRFKISEQYLDLKFQELDIKYEYEEKKQEEKEIEKELNKQKKDREKSEKAKEDAKAAEHREKIHQQELDKVRQELEQVAQAEVEKRKELELQYQQLEQQIYQARSDKEKANRVKWGYIYIISNISSFKGENIYKICMTQRNKPDEYISNMNPAVPFRFNIHFKIFSQDVFDTLDRLHNRFNDKRVNKFNSRKDFFEVSINEIDQVVKEIQRETGVLRIDEP